MDQKMSSEKDPRLIAVFEISIDFLEINWEFVQQHHDRWTLNRVQIFPPWITLSDRICFVLMKSFVKNQEEEEEKGGVPDLSYLAKQPLKRVQIFFPWVTFASTYVLC